MIFFFYLIPVSQMEKKFLMRIILKWFLVGKSTLAKGKLSFDL